MLNNGVPVIVVSKILGHAKPCTTMNIYGHLINEMQEEAARILDKLVMPGQVEFVKYSEKSENI
jgi:integrase